MPHIDIALNLLFKPDLAVDIYRHFQGQEDPCPVSLVPGMYERRVGQRRGDPPALVLRQGNPWAPDAIWLGR